MPRTTFGILTLLRESLTMGATVAFALMPAGWYLLGSVSRAGGIFDPDALQRAEDRHLSQQILTLTQGGPAVGVAVGFGLLCLLCLVSFGLSRRRTVAHLERRSRQWDQELFLGLILLAPLAAAIAILLTGAPSFFRHALSLEAEVAFLDRVVYVGLTVELIALALGLYAGVAGYMALGLSVPAHRMRLAPLALLALVLLALSLAWPAWRLDRGSGSLALAMPGEGAMTQLDLLLLDQETRLLPLRNVASRSAEEVGFFYGDSTILLAQSLMEDYGHYHPYSRAALDCMTLEPLRRLQMEDGLRQAFSRLEAYGTPWAGEMVIKMLERASPTPGVKEVARRIAQGGFEAGGDTSRRLAASLSRLGLGDLAKRVAPEYPFAMDQPVWGTVKGRLVLEGQSRLNAQIGLVDDGWRRAYKERPSPLTFQDLLQITAATPLRSDGSFLLSDVPQGQYGLLVLLEQSLGWTPVRGPLLGPVVIGPEKARVDLGTIVIDR